MFKRILSSIKRGTVSLTLIFLLIEFFDELHYAIGGAVLPALRADLALSYTQIGLLLGMPHVIGTLIEPVLMLLGDTRLRKLLVVGGGFVVIASVLAISSATSFPLVLVAVIASFPASGAFVTLSQATLMDLNPGREPHVMARWTVAGSLGNLVGPLLVAGGFALALGWRWSYLALAALALLLILLVLPRRFPAHKQTNPEYGGGENSSGAFESNTCENTSRFQSFRNLWQAIRNSNLLRWLILLELSDLLMDVFTGYVPLYFTDIVGLGPVRTSLLLTGLMITSLTADAILIPLLERVPGRRLVRVSAILAIGVYTTWLLVSWPLVKAILVAAVRFSTLGWYQVLQGEAYAAVPGRSGTVMAVNSFAGLLGGGIAWLVGWTASQAGLPAAMWLLLIGPISLALWVPAPTKQHNSADFTAAVTQSSRSIES